MSRSTPIVERALRGLHPASIDDVGAIRALLERARRARAVFHRGLNTWVDLETAFVEELREDAIVLRAENFDRSSTHGQIFLNFANSGRPYFFSTRRRGAFEGDRLVVDFPEVVFYRERRDRSRRAPDPAAGEPSRVSLAGLGDAPREARIEDVSPSGLGLVVAGQGPGRPSGPLTVRYLDGNERGRESRLELRSIGPAKGRSGWTRLGLVRADAECDRQIPIEYREAIEQPATAATQAALSLPAEPVPETPRVVVVEDDQGEEIVCLVDGHGDVDGTTAVIMPNGWGQTKEALLPLARTFVSTFRAHDLPIQVFRFDGIRRRGESYNDPECRVPGRESHHYVFSQGVSDIETLVAHARASGAARVIVVSFSAAAIEVRKAVARDRGATIDGWVSVVGSPDLQSMARSISGGVDYVGGHERGVRFGHQELLGVTVDIDRIAVDAAQNEMSFIEDSRLDLAVTKIPITWFHGEYDAWVDLDRVRDILSHGELANRKLIVLPTGHQLKTSRQAGESFRVIAREVARMAHGVDVAAVAPPSRLVRHLRVAESKRLPRVDADLQAFWHDYLMGRDRSVGIELLTSGSAYRAMMAAQVRGLEIEAGHRIADLGAGTGAFSMALARDARVPDGVEVFAVDYVGEALDRARARLAAVEGGRRITLRVLEADLDIVHGTQRVPVSDASFDGVVASLLLSYLECPPLVLAEMARILRPGGRLVLSSLCRDADISRLYVEAFAELEVGEAGSDLPELQRSELGPLARNFLNDAARILELEDAGAFHFLDPDELEALVREAGFVDVRSERALGDPPQAVVLSARRR